jgi:hypothetical protein
MPAYDGDLFDPPAPLAHVVLRNPVTGIAWRDVPMLLDSGADVTPIPQAALRQLQLAVIPERQYELSGYDDAIRSASAVRVEMIFCRRTFRGQFLLLHQPWGILGRNILNAIPLLLDGPHLMWDELRR